MANGTTSSNHAAYSIVDTFIYLRRLSDGGKNHDARHERREKRFLRVSWWPGGVGIEVENRHAGRVRHLGTEKRFFAGLVAGITALDGLAIREFEFR